MSRNYWEMGMLPPPWASVSPSEISQFHWVGAALGYFADTKSPDFRLTQVLLHGSNTVCLGLPGEAGALASP